MSGFPRHALLGACLVSALLACGDSTGPGGLRLRIEAVADGSPFMDSGLGGVPAINCDLRLDVETSGSGTATWEDAVFRYYMAPDWGEPIHTEIVPAAEIADAFRESVLDAGQDYQAYWRMTGAEPFRVEMVHRYRTEGGAVREAAASFDCGPTDLESIPSPTIERFEMVERTAPLEPGDTLRVVLEASSAAGLWSTKVTLSGPCGAEQSFVEQLVPDILRYVDFVLWHGCALGVPMTITLDVVDAGMRRASRELTPDVTLVDVTRPAIAPAWSLRQPQFTPTRRSWAMFAAETLDVRPNATDGSGIAMVFVEVQPAGFQDSVAVSGPSITQPMPLIIRPDWGDFRVSVWARDRTGLVSDTISSEDGELRVLPTNERPLRFTDIAGDVGDVAIDSKRGLVYLAQPSTSRITVLSMADLSVVRTIPLGSSPRDLDLVPSGDSLLAVPFQQRDLYVVDMTAPEPVVSVLHITVEPEQQIFTDQVRVAANGKAMVAYRMVPFWTGVMEVDLVTATQRVRDDLPRFPSVNLERSHDASTIAFALQRLHAYDVATDAWQIGIAEARDHVPLSLDATGDRLAIGEVIYDGTLAPVQQMEWNGGDAHGSVLSADGESLFYDIWWRGIIRARVDDGRVLERLTTPTSPGYQRATFKRVTPDGSTLVLVRSGTAGSRIMVLDIR